MRQRTQILVVEDDQDIADGLAFALRREGHEVSVARDGEAAVDRLRAEPPDLVLLDLGLPRRNGLEVLRDLRAAGRSVPVIILTARGEEIDRVRGLDLGADDYVTKPFGLAELLARVRARLRHRAPASADVPDTFTLDGATVDLRGFAVRRGEQVEPLSVREVDILRFLYANRGVAVPRSRFLAEVWGDEPTIVTRTVDQYVARLRRKIEVKPDAPKHLLTIPGVGYRFEV